jgi:hypothetical protein
MLPKRTHLRRQTRSTPRRRTTKTSQTSTASISRARTHSSANLRSPLRHRRHRPSLHRAKVKVKVNNPDTRTRPSSGAHGPRRPHDQAMADGVIEDPPSEDSRISRLHTISLRTRAFFVHRSSSASVQTPSGTESEHVHGSTCSSPASRHAPSSVISSFHHFVIRRTFPVRVQSF